MKKNQVHKQDVSRRKFIANMAILSSIAIVPRHVLGRGFIAPSDKINIGFIGAGKQAQGLANQFLKIEDAKITAVADVYAAKLKILTEKVKTTYAAQASQSDYKGVSSHTDFREVLANKDINAVVIATPDHWHAVMAVYAAKAGKDIYCEKPLSLTIQEGRAMVKAARKYNRVFQVGSMQRSWPEFRQAVELVRNKHIGDLKSVTVTVGASPEKYNLPEEKLPEGLDWNFWLGPNEFVHYNNVLAPLPDSPIWARWRYYKGLGGGDMTDWGAHMFDIAQWGLDKDNSGPVKITPPDGKDVKQMILEYDGGLQMFHQLTDDTNKQRGVRFVGTEGEVYVTRGKITTTPEPLATKVIGPDEKHVYKSVDHYRDWLGAIKTRSKPICDVEVGHRTASVCNLANIAYELKRPLVWNPKKEKFKNDDEANKMRGRELKKEWSI